MVRLSESLNETCAVYVELRKEESSAGAMQRTMHQDAFALREHRGR